MFIIQKTTITDVVENSANDIKNRPSQQEILNSASPGEVKEILRRLKKRKAPGADGINNQMLKNLGTKAVAMITNIINGVMRVEYYRTKWEHAEVIVFNKAGKDKKFPQNYRPISLLPALSKVIERTLKTG